MPNFTGRYLKQGIVGTYGSESLPNIKGSLGFSGAVASFHYTANNHVMDGVFQPVGLGRYNLKASYSTGDSDGCNTVFSASNSSSVYQEKMKVNPDNAEILYMIKY